MIIGSGLLANAFSRDYLHHEDVCIYAAGVSNSNCIDIREFARERERLENALRQTTYSDVFVYFSTCSVFDHELLNTPYVQHKLKMEAMVRSHSRNLILRLPQVAGKIANPHTLLNFIYARILHGESFNLWCNAKRNVIDIDDIVSIANQLIANKSLRNITLSIANVVNYSILEIVKAMELTVGREGIYNVVPRGYEYNIDVSDIYTVLEKLEIKFDNHYLEKTLNKYYKI
jgi:nucleoside-diphosphate-sugar epimerase